MIRILRSYAVRGFVFGKSARQRSIRAGPMAVLPTVFALFPGFSSEKDAAAGKFLRKEKVSAEADFQNRRLPQKFSEGGNLPGEGKPFSENLRGKGRSGQDLIGDRPGSCPNFARFSSFFSEDRKKLFSEDPKKPFREKNLVRNFRPKYFRVCGERTILQRSNTARAPSGILFFHGEAIARSDRPAAAGKRDRIMDRGRRFFAAAPCKAGEKANNSLLFRRFIEGRAACRDIDG